MLSITTFDRDGRIVHEDIKAKYVSLLSDTTYGPPPVVAPRDGKPPLAKPGDTVLFINPAHVPYFTITRGSDED